MKARREVWITGVGLLTCLGEGLEANWHHLERGDPPPYDDKTFAPYIVHPLPAISFDKQIPKKATSARWSCGNAPAPMRRAWR